MLVFNSLCNLTNYNILDTHWYVFYMYIYDFSQTDMAAQFQARHAPSELYIYQDVAHWFRVFSITMRFASDLL